MLSDIASFLSRSECDGGVVHCEQDMMSSCAEEVKSGKWDFNGKWPNLDGINNQVSANRFNKGC